jgi:hypothetical protein
MPPQKALCIIKQVIFVFKVPLDLTHTFITKRTIHQLIERQWTKTQHAGRNAKSDQICNKNENLDIKGRHGEQTHRTIC